MTLESESQLPTHLKWSEVVVGAGLWPSTLKGGILAKTVGSCDTPDQNPVAQHGSFGFGII